jgi:dihydroxyacetone kinase
MKKLMNQPSDFVDQSIRGILAAYPNQYTTCPDDLRAFYRKQSPVAGKVAIVTGGGFGHLPIFLGYVGPGLCDGVAVGNVFTSPSCEAILDVSRAVNSGSGILFLFGNYTGDGMNFAMAKDMLEMEDIASEIVTASDDLASSPRNTWQDRRGIAGIVFAYKIAGAAADAFKSLEEVKRITEKALENIASFGVAFTSCTLPDIGRPIFEIGDDEMEIGMGIHGEPGIRRGKLQTSQELAKQLTQAVISDLSLHSGDSVAVLVNGLGATSREELYIFYNDISKELAEAHLKVHKVFVDEFGTSLEMAGASLTLLKLDDELTTYLDAAASTPFANFNLNA